MALALLATVPSNTPADVLRPVPVTTLGGRGSDPGQFQRPSAVSFDVFGHLFVVDRGNNRIQEFDENWKAVRSIGGFGFSVGRFVDPRSIVADRGSRVYILDAPSGRVQTLDPRREPEGVILGADGQTLGDHRLYGLGVDASGTLYMSDRESQNVWVCSATGDSLGTWGGFGSGPGQFRRIAGLTVDDRGDVWVVDEGLKRVVHFDRAGAFVQAFAAAADSLKEARPTGIAIAADGRVAVADPGTHRVTLFSSEGAELAVLGGALDQEFKEPVGLAWKADRLAVADQGLHEVLVFDLPKPAR